MLFVCLTFIVFLAQACADDCTDTVDDCTNPAALRVICKDSVSAQYCKRSCNLCSLQTSAMAQGTSGRVFMIGFPFFSSLNSRYDLLSLTMFTIGNTDTAVKLCSPGLNTNMRREFIVQGSKHFSTSVDMSMRVEDGNKTTKGILVESEDPIIIYGWEVGGNTADSFLALPLESLGNMYYILTCSFEGSMSEFLLIGVYDQTNITIILPPENLIGNMTWSGALLKDDNKTIRGNLNRFETIQIQARGDLSGTYVESSTAIGVIVSNERTKLVHSGYLDNILEMIPSIEKWGKHFICVSTPQQRHPDIVRILARQADTVLRTNGSISKVIKIAKPGDVYSFNLPYNGSIEINANNPVLVGQYYTQDPAMTTIPPVEQWEESYTFAIPDDRYFDVYLIVVVRHADKSSISLDGGPLNASFEHVNSDFWKVILQVNRGKHLLSNARQSTFGALIFGYALKHSAPQAYFTPAGMKQRAISPVGSGNQIKNGSKDSPVLYQNGTICRTGHGCTLNGFSCSGRPDHYTASLSGCQCGFNHKQFDCACCRNGGCQCGAVQKDKCTSCYQMNLCEKFSQGVPAA